MSSHLKNIEQSSGLFKPEYGEAEHRAFACIRLACKGGLQHV